MANEALVATVKKIVAQSRDGKQDEAYAGWRELFASPAFSGYDPADQRQALRLMVLAKGVPQRGTPPMIEAHRAAQPALEKLVADHKDPGDHEMLGVSLLVTGDDARASEVLRAGLTIERERDPGSDLCGALMKRVSLI